MAEQGSNDDRGRSHTPRRSQGSSKIEGVPRGTSALGERSFADQLFGDETQVQALGAGAQLGVVFTAAPSAPALGQQQAPLPKPDENMIIILMSFIEMQKVQIENQNKLLLQMSSAFQPLAMQAALSAQKAVEQKT